MSEEGISSLVTPEKIEPNRRNISNVAAESSVSPSNGLSSSTRAFHRRASVGSFNPGTGNRAMRDSSTGRSNSSNMSQNVISRYLRASTGSCHDFCKYGMRHSPEEEKPRAPQHKRYAKTVSVELNHVQMMVLDEGKNVKVLHHKPTSDVKTRSSYLKPPSNMKSHSPKVKTSLDKEKAVKHHRPSTDTIGDLRKPKISSNVKTSSPRLNKAPLQKNKVSSTRKFSSPDPPEMINSVFFPSENAKAKVGQSSSSTSEMPRFGKKTDYPSSQLSSLKFVKVKPAVLRSGKSETLHEKERKKSGAETHRITAALKAPAKKISTATSLSPKLSVDEAESNRLRKAGSSKLMSSPKIQNQVSGDNCNTSGDKKVLEKTLHVIETASENIIVDNAILDDHVISSPPSPSPSPSPSFPKPWSHVESSFWLSQEKDKEEIEYSGGEPDKLISDNDEPLETGTGPFIPNYHAVSLVPSSPKALSCVESPSLLFDEEDDNEIDCSYNELDKSTFVNEPLEIATLQPVPIERAISSSSSPFSDKSLSREDFSSSLQDEEDSKEIKYLDGEVGKCSPNNDSLEIGNMQLDRDSPTIPSFPSPSSLESLSYAEPASSSPYEEEDNKEINLHEGDEPHEYISENDESPSIGNDHSISSFLSPSSPKSQSSSLSSHEEYIEEIVYGDDNDDSTENGNVPPAAAKEDYKKTQRKSWAAISEDNHCSPVKLKFKPGRVIDLQSDNNGPRRLRFRRGRDLGTEHRKGESRTLKKSEGNSAIAAEAEEKSSEKVVLKHQDVQDKKDSQVLFNNVIEETASKLVESRKSKVKALVGAFETVISLQESKPSP